MAETIKSIDVTDLTALLERSRDIETEQLRNDPKVPDLYVTSWTANSDANEVYRRAIVLKKEPIGRLKLVSPDSSYAAKVTEYYSAFESHPASQRKYNLSVVGGKLLSLAAIWSESDCYEGDEPLQSNWFTVPAPATEAEQIEDISRILGRL